MRQGVTGFDATCCVDPRAFKAVCYEVARKLGGSVSTFVFPSWGPNFDVAVLAWRSERVSVLCNSTYPLIAFAEPIGEGDMELCFCSQPEPADGFSKSGEFTCITLGELNTPVSELDLSELSDGEMKELRSWRPRNLGELVYNWWD